MQFKELKTGDWFKVNGSCFQKASDQSAESFDRRGALDQFSPDLEIEPVADWLFLSDSQIAAFLGIAEPMVVTVQRSFAPDQPNRYLVRKLRLDAWGQQLPSDLKASSAQSCPH